MNIPIILPVAALLFSFGYNGFSQSANDGANPTIGLDQALTEAIASGDDFALVDKTIGVARMQRSLDLARQGASLSATGAYSLVDGIGEDSSSSEQALVSKAESASGSLASSQSAGIAQGAQGGLALITPLSKLSFSVTQTMPQASAANQASVFGLTGSHTLFDGYPGGQFKATLEKSALTLQSRELQARQGYSAAVAKVKQSFIAMLAAQRDLGIKRQVLDKQTRLLGQIKAVYALRQASDIDLKTAEINAKAAELDVTVADKTLRLANERLAAILGRPTAARFSVAEVPDPSLPAATVEDAIGIGLEKRADLAQYGISARSANIDAALARATAKPSVSLTGGAGVSVSWLATPLVAEALSVGAKLALPIVDSGVADLQAKVTVGQGALYELQAAQLTKTIAADIRDAFETTQLLAQKADLAKQSADLADAQFELTKTQNKYGTATTQDVLTASVTAATAEVSYGTARNAYLLAVLSLETAMGQ